MHFDWRLWAMTHGVRWRIAWSVLVGLIAVAFGIARLALLGWLLARVFNGEPATDLLLPGLVVVAVMVIRAGLEHYRALVAHDTAALVQAELRRDLHERLAQLGPAHFTQARTGAVLLTLVDGVEQLEIYFGRYLPQLAVALMTPMMIFGFVAFLDLAIAMVMLLATLVVLLAPALWHHRDISSSIEHRRSYKQFASEFLDALQGLTTLKAFGQSGARATLLRDKADRLYRSTVKVMAVNTLSRGITDAGIAIATAVAIAWGAFRVSEGQMEIGVLLVVLMLGVEVFRPLRELRTLMHDGMVGMSAAQGIFELLDAKPSVTAPSEPGLDSSGLAASVRFDGVCFAYPGGRQPAHDGMNFTIDSGETVALVGASGSGKSTIAKLLLRFYDPQQGRVLIGEHDIRSLTFDQLYDKISIVNQDAYLFHGSVAENLRMGRPGASDAELVDAAKIANAHEFITRLPEGYQTVIGERGLRLSGGQRQRIGIARAVLRDAPILILDEALSSVDADNEALIQQALQTLMTGRTTLIFAHRLSSVIDADRILVIDQGRIAESGSHRALMARAGIYHQLMSAQAHDSRDSLSFESDQDSVASNRADPSTPVQAVESEANAGEPVSTATAAEQRAAQLSAWQVVRLLLATVGDYTLHLVTTFGLGVVRVIAFIGVGVLSALAIRALKNGEPFEPWLVALFVVAPLAGILHWLESWLAHNMAYALLADMRIDLFNKLDKLAPAYLLRRRSGDILGVVTHDIELIEYFFAHTVAPAFVAIFIPATVLIILSMLGWPMALALLPFLAYAGLSPVLSRARIDRLGEQSRAAAGDLNADAVDAVQGLADVIAYQQTASRNERFAAKTKAHLQLRKPFLADLSRQTALQELATGLGGLAVIVVGAGLVTAGSLEAGLLPLAALLAGAAFLPISEIAQVGRQLADTMAATRRVHAVHSEPVAVEDGPDRGTDTGDDTVHAIGKGGALQIRQATFTYPDRKEPALADVTLDIPTGHSVALVGPSGAGKSTLANLLLRFWDVDAGSITLAGRDLRRYPLDELRQRIALVAQDTYLFNDTLRANILLAQPAASADDIRRALDRAALSDFVAAAPNGLETIVGERGTQLSGGQRQRVAIARAFLKDAPIVILDEATSHLDAISEQTVRNALRELMQGRTTVVIAHRLSTVRDADEIVVLDQGRIRETGSHDELLSQRGLYAHMVARQLAGALPQAV